MKAILAGLVMAAFALVYILIGIFVTALYYGLIMVALDVAREHDWLLVGGVTVIMAAVATIFVGALFDE